MQPIWDPSALTENDQTIAKVKYEGDNINAEHFIIASSLSSFSLIDAITKNAKQAGSIVLNVFELDEPTKYSNGEESNVRLLRTLKNKVFLVENTCILSLEHTSGCESDLVKLFYETFKPKDVIVLSSTHLSLFNGNADVPTLFSLSEDSNNENGLQTLPLPNIICGIAAGFLLFAKVYNSKCKILQMVEDDYGPSAEVFKLWAENISSLIKLDVNDVAKEALVSFDLRSNDTGLLYT